MAVPSALVFQTKTLQLQVSAATRRAVSRLVPDLSKLSQNEAGGALRTIAIGSISQFGNVATQSARISYDGLREASVPAASQFSARALEIRTPALTDVAVGTAMALVQSERFGQAASTFVDVIDKSVSDVFRETLAQASFDDRDAVGYQRIASPNACAFCALVATNEYTSFAEDGGYHNSCGCTTIPIFRGLGAFRPSYYEDFEREYVEAAQGATATRDILRQMREQTGRR